MIKIKEELSQKEIIKIVLNELEKRNIIRSNFSTYKNTEQILRDYPKLKQSIKDRQEQINDYKNYGLQEKSKSITSISQNNNIRQDSDDIINSSIASLEIHIFKTKIVLKFIDNVLDKFKDDPYIDVIKLHYFEDKTYNQIAEIFDHKFGKKDKLTAPATVGSNNQRLVRELQKYLFPNDYLYQLLGY